MTSAARTGGCGWESSGDGARGSPPASLKAGGERLGECRALRGREPFDDGGDLRAAPRGDVR
ncbi:MULTISPECIES: hypothetical protein [Streptomyces]|uniref:hypothetical protein n=1 Tax=Streptomyces TaxID=1883 RepID=UPI001EFB7BAB|nr:hypothetical protein [Streptomyces sp. CL12-4]MCG8964386.1 hypothetical protein [Streptomyces sp. CL12-4]